MKESIRTHKVATGGIGPFVTWTRQVKADGGVLVRTSRRHRKGLAAVFVAPGDIHPHIAVGAIGHEWSHLWAPRWIG